MGVDLSALISTEKISFEKLLDKKIAVDGMNTLYQFLSIIRQFDGTPLKDSHGNITSHLSGLFYRTVKFMEYGIKPIYVFDGKSPDLKATENAARKKRREEAFKEWERLKSEGKTKEAYQKAMQATKVTKDIVTESKKLLEYMGVPYIQAESEGEAQAAFMNQSGQVWAVASQDYDSILFNCKRFIKNLSISGKRKIPRKDAYIKINPEIIETSKVLEHLGISHEKLIWIAILIGTDFNPEGIKGVGPKKALEIVKKHETFDSVLDDPKVKWECENDPDKILKFFKNPPVKKVDFEFKDPNPEKLREFLNEQHDFSLNRIASTLNKLIELKKSSQKGLGSFF